MLYRYIYIGGLMGYIYTCIYKYISQKVAIYSLWTVCPCFFIQFEKKGKFEDL